MNLYQFNPVKKHHDGDVVELFELFTLIKDRWSLKLLHVAYREALHRTGVNI
jgi:hypothetical protein